MLEPYVFVSTLTESFQSKPLTFFLSRSHIARSLIQDSDTPDMCYDCVEPLRALLLRLHRPPWICGRPTEDTWHGLSVGEKEPDVEGKATNREWG